jgi:hypothetical protein
MQRPPRPIHTPNTTPHGALAIPSLVRFLQHPRRETTHRVHRQRASSTPTAHQHHHWQLLPSHEHEHVCTSTSCMGSLASCTLQQLREVRPVKIDGGFESAHPPTGSGACPCRTVCVYGVTGCTAESSRAFGGNAPVLCSTVVDAARNGGSGSQAHSHVGGCVTSKLLCMLDPNHTDASLLTLCATHLPAGTLRGSWWKLAVRVPPVNVCQHV